ncbi:hypothetical protein [Natranaerobius thermophilus]|uniref:PepSY domain-containing protein n=1 Tax=Natranaerobius thermophilus (strain ATCC BAA-1301 / DSM 18059 / JW/NM-WN-LF) TaxID=457570 RepID=B2A1S0_NATTJ|nr:hypothetical protein [Natranaerobius thermophilus]ACB86117.1 hypothetical protein Nther_2559 [Natranaerobius thermophilus JW/NM-WN-LF]
MKVLVLLLGLLLSVTALGSPSALAEEVSEDLNLTEEEAIEIAENIHPLTEELNLERSDYLERQGIWYLNYQSDPYEEKHYTLSFNICDEDEVIDTISFIHETTQKMSLIISAGMKVRT